MALGAVTRSDLADPAPYTKTFFDLQLRFAHTVSALSGLPLARAILEYTNFYIRFGLGREFNSADPAWTEYLAGLQRGSDPGDWTYRFHLAHSQAVVPPGLVASFGCFSYSRLRDDRVRLHFRNAETDGLSPLGIEHRGQRLGARVLPPVPLTRRG